MFLFSVALYSPRYFQLLNIHLHLLAKSSRYIMIEHVVKNSPTYILWINLEGSYDRVLAVRIERYHEVSKNQI